MTDICLALFHPIAAGRREILANQYPKAGFLIIQITGLEQEHQAQQQEQRHAESSKRVFMPGSPSPGFQL